MKAYLRVFVNFEQNVWAKLLPMGDFAYNNANNTNTSYISFELNCGHHPRVSYKENINPCFKFKSIDKLLTELWQLMTVCHKNLHHAQELQKQTHNKGVKPKGNKLWLNSKYIKTK